MVILCPVGGLWHQAWCRREIWGVNRTDYGIIDYDGIMMWREESLFYIGQYIGDYFGDNQRGFGLVQRAGSREIQAATTEKGSIVVG